MTKLILIVIEACCIVVSQTWLREGIDPVMTATVIEGVWGSDCNFN